MKKTLLFLLVADCMIFGQVSENTKSIAQKVNILKTVNNPKNNDYIIPGISLGISGIPNLRDIGGYKTNDGKTVKFNLLYRSNEPSSNVSKDLERISSLRLINDFDFRTNSEISSVKDIMPSGVNYKHLNILADNANSAASSLESLFGNPNIVNKELGDGKALKSFLEVYKQLVSSPSALKNYSIFFNAILDEKQLPSLFHCTTGKDRTGWAAASLLTLLGVSKEQVYYDYLQTNNYILPLFYEERQLFISNGGDSGILDVILQVRPEYLDAAFEEVNVKYGSVENYFDKGLGIDKAKQTTLKKIFLQ